MYRAYKKWEHTWYKVGEYDSLSEAVDHCLTYCPATPARVLDRRGMVVWAAKQVVTGGSIVGPPVV